MLSLRIAAAAFAVFLLNFKLSTCRSPGEGGRGPVGGEESGAMVDLPGVDTGSLTNREKHDWSSAVSELLAPCPDQPVSLAQCVKESRACNACLPAAKFLAKQVQKGKTRSQLDVVYKKRFALDQVKDVPVAGSPSRGPENAPVTIVEFADFECPACGKAYPTLEKLLEKHAGKIRFVFKNYPLSSHKYAEKAARAAMAAAKQGKFWEMHHKLFELQPEPADDAAIEKIAKGLGLDMKKFADDAASEAVADEVARDRKHGDALELKSTPYVFINGRAYDLDYFDFSEDLSDWISLELELRGGGEKAVAKGAQPPAAKDPAAPSASAAASAPPPASSKLP